MTPEQQRTHEAVANPNDPFAPQNAVVRQERSLWPNGVVPYVLDGLNSKLVLWSSKSFQSFASSAAQAINAINAAINTYAQQTCIQFVQRTNQPDYVRFFPGGGYVRRMKFCRYMAS